MKKHVLYGVAYLLQSATIMAIDEQTHPFSSSYDSSDSEAAPGPSEMSHNLFAEIKDNQNASSLELAGLALFNDRLLISYKLNYNILAQKLERNFTDFHRFSHIDVDWICDRMLFGLAGAAFGAMVGSCFGGIFSLSPLIYAPTVSVGTLAGASVPSCLEAKKQEDPWDVMKSPIPIDYTKFKSEWVTVNIKEHRKRYRQKVTDALNRDFNSFKNDDLTIIKTSLLDINGALPITELTRDLPEGKKKSPFLDPKDIRKFKVKAKEDEDNIELYAYGQRSIRNTSNLVTYLNAQDWSVVRSVYKILDSVVDHKNFFAHTDKHNHVFEYVVPTQVN